MREANPRTIRMIAALLLGSFAVGCSDGATDPSNDPVPGPTPPGLTGKVAFATMPGPRASDYRVHVVDMATRSDRIVHTNPAIIDDLTWAPDGRHLVMSTLHLFGDDDASRLERIDLEGAEHRTIFNNALGESSPTYSTTGRLAYFAARRVEEFLAQAAIYVDGFPVHPLAEIGSGLAWTGDGSGLFYTASPGGLARFDLRTKTVTQIIADEPGEVIETPAVSPDGARVAFVRRGDGRDEGEIWIAGASGDSPRLLSSGFPQGSPAWAPDGSHVAFRRGGAAPGIYVIDPDGGAALRVVAVDNISSGIAWSR